MESSADDILKAAASHGISLIVRVRYDILWRTVCTELRGVSWLKE